MKKILACTSIRSDYDLMSQLYRLLHEDEQVELKLLVSGAHLSHEHGYSYSQIEEDGFDVLLSVETLLSSDSKVSRIKSAGILLQGSVEIINQYSPDLIIFAGDREDVIIYSLIGGYLNIPTVHFFAGDHVTDGYVDNPIRHATSKIASAHCVTLEEHKKRLVRMGEKPERICVTGNLALDRFVKYEPMPLASILEKIDTKVDMDNYVLVIFHPVTQEHDNAHEYFENILKNILELGMSAFVSYPNVDHGNYKLVEVINKYSDCSQFYFYRNLDRDLFLSIYKHAKMIIGNSSSGICEAATLKVPAINVGSRQTGRFADQNVIFCDPDYQSIQDSLGKALSDKFQEELKAVVNSYGDGKSAIKAYNFIKHTNFAVLLEKTEDPLQVKLL